MNPETVLDDLELERDRRIALITVVLLLVPTLWFHLGDAQAADQLPALLEARRFVRLGFLLSLLAAAWALHRVPDRTRYERLVLGFGLASAAFILALNALRLPGSSLPMRTPLLWLLAYYAGLVNRPRLQVLPPLIVSVGVVGLRLSYVSGDATGSVWGDVVVLLAANAIGLHLVQRREASRQLEHAGWRAELAARHELEATVAELRQLRGIIPICSYCKQVRTEQGDWQQIEAYVRERSAAEFSHGICPNCLRLHYPEMEGR